MKNRIIVFGCIISCIIICSLSFQPVIAGTPIEELNQYSDDIDELLINIINSIIDKNMDILKKPHDFLDTITFKDKPIIFFIVASITESSHWYWGYVSSSIFYDIDRFIEYKEQFPKFIESFLDIISNCANSGSSQL